MFYRRLYLLYIQTKVAIFDCVAHDFLLDTYPTIIFWSHLSEQWKAFRCVSLGSMKDTLQVAKDIARYTSSLGDIRC